MVLNSPGDEDRNERSSAVECNVYRICKQGKAARQNATDELNDNDDEGQPEDIPIPANFAGTGFSGGVSTPG